MGLESDLRELKKDKNEDVQDGDRIVSHFRSAQSVSACLSPLSPSLCNANASVIGFGF